MVQLENKHGVGIEMEGFIIDETGRPHEFIGEKPSSEWIMERAKEKFPQIVPHLGFEQASVMLEVRTDVGTDDNETAGVIIGIRELLNREILAPTGLQLHYIPVPEKGFTFVPATSDPDSRTHQLIRSWGKASDGLRKLYSTAIASMQVNDSRPFRGVVGQENRLELARQVYNGLSASYDELKNLEGINDSRVRSFHDMNRIEHLEYLLCGVKGEQFRNYGFLNPMDVVKPPHFQNIEDLKRWMCAHSDVSDFALADSKDAHAITAKVKMGSEDQPWVVESRYAAAQNTREGMLDVLRDFRKRLEGVVKEVLLLEENDGLAAYSLILPDHKPSSVARRVVSL